MTDLADYWPPREPREAFTPRKCRHPRAFRRSLEGGGSVCSSCGHQFDEATVRRGRSARRLGNDQERRIEKVYGPTKIGERGDPVDHLGRVWRWQSKATRSLPPRWLAKISEPTYRAQIPMPLRVAWNGMIGHYGDRRSLVIRSYVRNGGLAAGRTRDWIFLADTDAAAELGMPPGLGWYVIPGDWWLEHFGRDE